MANTNKPFGLRPYSNIYGNNNGSVRMFHVPATDTTAIFVGDTVKLAGTETSFEGFTPAPVVTKAATSDAVVGVMVGVLPDYDDLTIKYRKASTAMNVFVACDPDTIFVVQGDSDTYTGDDVGLNMSITVSTGSTTTGVSNAVLDQSTAATTTTLACQILGSAPVENNDLTGGYPLVLVKLNNHQYVNATTGL